MPAGVEHALIAVLGHLADATLRTFALALVAALGLVALRIRSAALTLGVWTAVLGAAMLMPAISQLAPAVRWSLTIPLPPAPVIALAAPGTRHAAPGPANARIDARSAAAAAQRLSTVTPVPAPPLMRSSPRLSWPMFMAIVYLAGVVTLAARMIAGWLLFLRLERRATVVADPAVRARLQSQMARADLARAPRLLEGTGLVVPVTTGVVKPAVILPAAWRKWDGATLEVVLVHELSHVARRDALTQRVSLLYRALYWFNPFSWWLHRRLVELGEQASDDAVLSAGADRVAYAETLLGFFAAMRGAGRRLRWHVAMASGASAERRVERILKWRGSRARGLTRLITLVIFVALTPVAVVVATASATLVRTELSMLPAPPRALVAAVPTALKTSGGLLPAALPADHASQQLPPSESSAQSAPPQPTGASPQPGYLGPPARNDLADRQMVDFVFDLRTLPDEDLKRAATTAATYVDQMWTRADVGLNVFHVAAVHVLSATVETIQDFTWDKVRIQDALASVGARVGSAGGTSETRLKNVAAICDSLAQRTAANAFAGSNIPPAFMQLVDGKAVMYFGNGAIRKMDAPFDVADLARACARSNVSFFSINGATFFDPLPPPVVIPVGVSLEIVPRQVGSPLSLLGSKSTLDYGYAVVTVQNNSFVAIKSLTLAALVIPNDPALSTPQVFTAHLPGAAIAPNGRLTISTRLIDGATLASLAVKGAKAQLGVVDVEFDDGRHWTYDLKAQAQFEIDGPVQFAFSFGLAERAVQAGRMNMLPGVIDAVDVPPDDPFAVGAHRIREAGLQPPRIDGPLILGTADQTKPVRIVLVDAIVDATGHVLRVRTARSLDDSPGGIDQRALVLVRETTFTPARFLPTRFNGESVTVLVRVPVLVYY